MAARGAVRKVEDGEQRSIQRRARRSSIEPARERGDGRLDRAVELFELLGKLPARRCADQVFAPEGDEQASVCWMLVAELEDRLRGRERRGTGILLFKRRQEGRLRAAHRSQPEPGDQPVA